MGRPAKPIPRGLNSARPYIRLPENAWARLESVAADARRSLSAEIEVALEAYLDAHPVLPVAGEVDAEHERRRVRLAPHLVRRLDALGDPDAREARLVAAVTWWLS